MLIDTTDEQLELLAQGERPAIVKFWSAKCGACRMLAPAFAELAQQGAGQVWFLNAQIEEVPQAVAALGVDKLPTLIIFREGRELDRLIGVPRHNKLIDFVSQVLI